MSQTQSETPLPAVRVPRGPLYVALDLLAAAILTTLLVASAVVPTPMQQLSGPPMLRVAIATVSGSVVATRRFAPVGSLAAAVGSSMAAWTLGFERDAFLTASLVLYVVASSRPPRRSGLCLAAAATATIAAYLCVRPDLPFGMEAPWWQGFGNSLTSVAIEAAGWALGLAVYRQRSYLDTVRAQAARELGAERDRAARSAAEERLRIARDLHDIVAHAMSVITVQAGVARYLRPEGPDRAGEALAVIESTGRQALRDMRQLLGVLREEHERGGSPQAPAPGLSDLPELFDGTRAAGTRVELSVRGDARSLPEGVELSAYRIVQEALTNVVKHADTDHARVVLDYAPLELAITVLDDGARASGQAGTGPEGGGGHGLVGMRERAALHGGTVDAGPLPLRGFRVAARLPLDAADAAGCAVPVVPA